jgi:GxxExxY protein
MKIIEPNKELDELAHKIIGAAIEVHRHLGAGYLEALYEEALCLELTMQNIAFQRQAPIGVAYKGHAIGEGRIDILVENRLIVELKAVESLLPIHKAQVLSYLKAKNLTLGLLINFNVVILKDGVKRIIRSY